MMVTFNDLDSDPWSKGQTWAELRFAASPVDGVDALLEFGTAPDQLSFLEYRPDYLSFHNFTVNNLAPGTEYFYRVTFSGTDRLGVSLVKSFSTLPGNVPPQVFDITAAMNEDEGPILVSPSFSDPDGPQAPAFRIVTDASNGTALWNGNNFIYTPNLNFFGTDSFTYAANDGEDEGAPATVTITVRPVNDPGVIVSPPQLLTVLEDSPASGSVAISDVEGDQHSLRIVSGPAKAVLLFGTNFIFRAGANVNGTFTIGFSAVDRNGVAATGIAWVTIEVISVNDAPVAVGLGVMLEEDTVAPFTLQGFDIDSPNATYAIVEGPSHGTLTGSGRNYTYTPFPNYCGPDRIIYKMSDGLLESDPGLIDITVLAVEDLPIALPQTVSTVEDRSVTITLTATDPDGGAFAWSVVTQPAHGTLSGEAPNLVYTPNPNFNGADSFIFRNLQSEATVSIQVGSVNDVPVANNLSVTTAYNNPVQTPLSGSDLDGSPLTFIIDTMPNGTLSGTLPNIYFIPAIGSSGTTSFTYHVNDGQTDSAPATVTITVLPTTTPPNTPGGIIAQAISSTEVNLSWRDNTFNEDGYLIERATGQNWVQVGTIGPGYGPYTLSFTDTTVQPNKSYNYRVRSFNVIGTSPYSTTVSVKTPK
jgi:large repetitive protein